MPQALTKEEERRRKMVALYPRAHGPDVADRCRAIAEWWRLHAETSANPSEPTQWADNQDRIADDMEARPGHHRCRPLDITRYEWSQR